MKKNNLKQIDQLKLNVPKDARAILIWINEDGTQKIKSVDHESSVLNIKNDLLKHLNEHPYTDAWLTQIRDAINQRIEARKVAKIEGKIAVPSSDGSEWIMV